MASKYIFTESSTLLDLNRKFRELSSDAGKGSLKAKTSITVLANFSTQYLVSSLHCSLMSDGIAPDIYESSFDQWEFELANTDSETYRRNSDYLLIALSSTRLAVYQMDAPEELALKLFGLINLYKSKCSGEVVVVLPESLSAGFDVTSWFYTWVKSLRRELRRKLGGLALFIDIDPLIMEFGIKRWHPAKYFLAGKLCCHPNCFPLYGNYISNFIKSLIQRNTRLIIVDLDNTLWNGVVGDVGWEGVGLDKDSTGYPHLMLQKYLLSLKNAGMLLAICSKNSPEPAAGVFKHRREMVLKESDFVSREINWAPKSDNIKKILQELNLTSVGVLFLDDSKFEREEVRSRLPEIIVSELPDNPEEWCEFLSRSGYLTVGKVQGADLAKSDKYEAEKLRREAAAGYSDYSEFLRSLGLQITPQPVAPDNLDRVFELVHKTNQFNLTANRMSRSELQRLSVSSDCFCYCYSLADKYSDYGIISVFIAEKKAENWEINTWLMSCRAMGRGVEYAVFDHFVSTRLAKDEVVVGRYVATEKNKPVSDLLAKMDFVTDTSSGTSVFSVGKNKKTKVDYIRVGGTSV